VATYLVADLPEVVAALNISAPVLNEEKVALIRMSTNRFTGSAPKPLAALPAASFPNYAAARPNGPRGRQGLQSDAHSPNRLPSRDR
jgi:hypothetical protein